MAQAETEKLTQIIIGAALSRAVCTAAELGIADLIQPGSPQSVESMAKSTGAHERSLYRLLRFMANHGIFSETAKGKFGHTNLSKALRGDAEGSFKAGAQMWHQVFGTFDGLHHSVMTGEAGFVDAYGKPIFDYIMEHPELAPVFDAAMTSIHGYETPAMLESYDFSDIDVLADIGGGNGTLIGSILKQYPNLEGILFDLGHVVERAEENLKTLDVADRVKVIEGNFFENIPKGADAYLFRHIIHDWTDEQCVQILKNCRDVIPDSGKLLIVECVVPEGNEQSISKDFDIAMMIAPGGIERTEAEYKALFKDAGFELSSITPTKSMVSVVEGRPV